MYICIDRVVRVRAAMLRHVVWPSSKRELKVFFRGASEELYHRIMASACEWSEHCGMEFKVGRAWHMSDIRVDIGNDGMSWSYLGSQAQTIGPDQPTMHYGWIDMSTPDSEFRRVVQHEFGHALGLIHEHQNPADGIKWNRERIYEIYGGPPNYWDKSTVDVNVLGTYDRGMTNFTEFDPCSIMLYPVSPDMTQDGFSVGFNDCISETDAAFVGSIYPKRVIAHPQEG